MLRGCVKGGRKRFWATIWTASMGFDDTSVEFSKFLDRSRDFIKAVGYGNRELGIKYLELEKEGERGSSRFRGRKEKQSHCKNVCHTL